MGGLRCMHEPLTQAAFPKLSQAQPTKADLSESALCKNAADEMCVASPTDRNVRRSELSNPLVFGFVVSSTRRIAPVEYLERRDLGDRAFLLW
jgi:hypothetical protein